LGIYIHNVKDLNGRTDTKGANPFDYLSWNNGQGAPLSQTYPTYDWMADNGRANLSSWIEAAAQQAGR
jgi:hypothetical protein